VSNKGDPLTTKDFVSHHHFSRLFPIHASLARFLTLT
jgi:hypothetical protein